MCDRLRKAVADMREYEQTGGDDNWLQWPEKFDVLYAALDEDQPREWQGLTDEEVEAAWKSCDPKRLLPSFAAAIEAALKGKNHDRP